MAKKIKWNITIVKFVQSRTTQAIFHIMFCCTATQIVRLVRQLCYCNTSKTMSSQCTHDNAMLTIGKLWYKWPAVSKNIQSPRYCSATQKKKKLQPWCLWQFYIRFLHFLAGRFSFQKLFCIGHLCACPQLSTFPFPCYQILEFVFEYVTDVTQ